MDIVHEADGLQTQVDEHQPIIRLFETDFLLSNVVLVRNESVQFFLSFFSSGLQGTVIFLIFILILKVRRRAQMLLVDSKAVQGKLGGTRRVGIVVVL